MLQNQPPEQGEGISAEFLEEVAELADRNIGGVGVHTTPFATNIMQQMMFWLALRGYPFRNDSGEEVPTGGCLAVDGPAFEGGQLSPDIDGNIPVACSKPSTTFRRLYVLNMGNPVPAGDYGRCFTPGGYDMAMALYDTGTPALGESYGPTPGQWYLTKDYPSIFHVGGVTESGTMLGSLHLIQQQAKHYTQIVQVTNNGSPEEDWPALSPIGVCTLDDVDPSDIVASASSTDFLPTFLGCRLDDYSFDSGYNRMLGITQKAIPYGETGSVCIRGVTSALVQKLPSGWTAGNYGNWVQVRKIDDRWMLRRGLGGDARLLQYLDFGTYLDGEYDDQQVVLIDLCSVPNRRYFSAYTEEKPAFSVVNAPLTSQFAFKIGDQTDFYYALRHQQKLAGTCGWDVPASKYGWLYYLNDTIPVCLTLSFPHSYGTNAENYGPATDSFAAWPYLTGFKAVARDNYDPTSPPYSPSTTWFSSDMTHIFAKAEDALTYFTGGTFQVAGLAWPSNSSGSVVYDGGVYGGVTYPVIYLQVTLRYRSNAGFIPPRCPNVQAGTIFEGLIEAKTGGLYLDDPIYWDDPIGTVKMWNLSVGLIPSGWREYTAMQDRFPIGVKAGGIATGVGATGGSQTHMHPAGTGIASGSNLGAANHIPPYSGIIFIERYQ